MDRRARRFVVELGQADGAELAVGAVLWEYGMEYGWEVGLVSWNRRSEAIMGLVEFNKMLHVL